MQDHHDLFLPVWFVLGCSGNKRAVLDRRLGSTTVFSELAKGMLSLECNSVLHRRHNWHFLDIVYKSPVSALLPSWLGGTVGR